MEVVDPTSNLREYDLNEGASTSRGAQFGRGLNNQSESDDGEFHPTIRVLGEETRQFNNLGIDRVRMRLQFLNPPERGTTSLESYNILLSDWLNRAFNVLLSIIPSRLRVRPQDKVGISFTRSSSDSFSLSFRRFDQYNPLVLLSHISRVLQSNAEFLFDEDLEIEVTHIRSDVGYGRQRYLEGISTFDYAAAHSRSVILINPMHGRETLCLAYALVLGIAHAEKNKNLFNTLLYPPNIDTFTEKAIELCERANVDLSNGGGTFELKRFQKYFKDSYNIILFADRKGRNIIYRGYLKNGNRKKIFLLLEDSHYLLVTNLHAAFSVNYYCDQCLRASYDSLSHKDCPYTCNKCYSKPPCQTTEKMYCNQCNRSFYGYNCYRKHIESGVCNRLKVCPKCIVSYRFNKKRKHVCGIKYCSTCRQERATSHNCFIPPVYQDSEDEDENKETESKTNSNKKKKKDETITEPLFIFYDFETVQHEPLPGQPNKIAHLVNLALAQQACKSCEKSDNDINIDCELCGKREHMFMGADSLHMFMQYFWSKEFTKSLEMSFVSLTT